MIHVLWAVIACDDESILNFYILFFTRLVKRGGRSMITQYNSMANLFNENLLLEKKILKIEFNNKNGKRGAGYCVSKELTHT